MNRMVNRSAIALLAMSLWSTSSTLGQASQQEFHTASFHPPPAPQPVLSQNARAWVFPTLLIAGLLFFGSALVIGPLARSEREGPTADEQSASSG